MPRSVAKKTRVDETHAAVSVTIPAIAFFWGREISLLNLRLILRYIDTRPKRALRPCHRPAAPGGADDEAFEGRAAVPGEGPGVKALIFKLRYRTTIF